MYQFVAAQQTSTAKLLAFLSRFQTKEQILWVNKSKITGENTFNGDHFGLKGDHESIKEVKILFGVIFQGFEHPYILYKYTYVFRALFRFCNFLANSCGFGKLGVS